MNIVTRRSHTRSLCQQALELLPFRLCSQLSKADRKQLLSTFNQLEEQSRHLSYLPIFGYLSLRSDNYRELGKSSQDDVVQGRDVVNATLPNHGLDFVISTVYRGTPEQPGVVAGLSARADMDTPGVVLKVPKSAKCLATILEREFFAESDLEDSAAGSNSMYRPYLKNVVLEDGSEVQALTFLTNPQSIKALSTTQKITPRLLASLMSSTGGFRRKDGDDSVKGGSCWSYWMNSYIRPRKKAGQQIDPMVEEALMLAQLLPASSFSGIKFPHELVTLQKPERKQAIVRVRESKEKSSTKVFREVAEKLRRWARSA